MKFNVMTLFPEIIEGAVNHSILRRGIDKGLIDINCINIRDFSNNKHKKVDDYPYGGGNGMVMSCQPIYDAFESIKNKISKDTPIIYMSPRGRKFNQEIAKELSKEKEIVLLCGHYEGVDERIIELICDDTISIGDFVLTGGELPAIMVIDAVSRLIPEVLNNSQSFVDESFENNLLEYPQYTRPENFRGMKVPEVLLSGHHGNIEKFRKNMSEEITKKYRPDLWEKYKNGQNTGS